MKLDEFSIGDIFETKPYSLTEEDVKKFASEFDPQYMHLDHEKASQGMFSRYYSIRYSYARFIIQIMGGRG